MSKLQLALVLPAQVAPETIANPATDPALEAALNQLRGLLKAQTQTQAPTYSAPGLSTVPPLLQVLQASVGNHIRMVPVDEVLYFEAADKYVRMLTAEHEYLLRTALKDLLPQLDPQAFWQVHRGTVVRATAIDTVSRDETGRMHLRLRDRSETLAVSRLYAPRFKAM